MHSIYLLNLMTKSFEKDLELESFIDNIELFVFTILISLWTQALTLKTFFLSLQIQQSGEIKSRS